MFFKVTAALVLTAVFSPAALAECTPKDFDREEMSRYEVVPFSEVSLALSKARLVNSTRTSGSEKATLDFAKAILDQNSERAHWITFLVNDFYGKTKQSTDRLLQIKLEQAATMTEIQVDSLLKFSQSVEVNRPEYVAAVTELRRFSFLLRCRKWNEYNAIR